MPLNKLFIIKRLSMDEFKFVFKCLLFAALVVFASQIQVGEETLEDKAQIFLSESETAHYLQKSAIGGALLIQKGIQESKEFIQSKMARTGGSNEPLNHN